MMTNTGKVKRNLIAVEKPQSNELHYQLREEELRSMQALGLINNYSLVYFILKLQNPFCDRAIQIKPNQIAKNWGISEASVYRAIAKLKGSRLISVHETDRRDRYKLTHLQEN